MPMRPFTTTKTLEAMRRIPLFSTLDDADLQDFLAACRRVRVRAGIQIFSPDDQADSLFVILSGRVKVYKLSPKGDEQILHLYGPGSTFGEAAMWDAIDYPAHAAAVADTTLLVVTRETLRETLARKPELALEMIAGMSTKLQEFNRLIEQLSLREVPARLAGILLELSREAGSDTIRLRQSKRELAAQIGTIAETLSRAFARLKKAGLIEVKGAKITVLDPGGLEEIAES